ncbi:MAG: type II toxin-antitoxin system PemK/MazF family toxin [Janthinobacterium lividum]
MQSGLSQVVLAMVTSQMTRAGHPSRVTVLVNSPEGRRAGLVTDSVVMTDNLVTITVSAITHVIGSLPMSEVDAALRYTLNL